MTTFLLDVNVLIALVDPSHVHHNIAHDWFADEGSASFATCPITENGLVRIVGNPRYPNSPGTPAIAAELLAGIRELAGHEFWPDDISLMDQRYFALGRLLSPAQLTDSYLLALARRREGMLATLDKKLTPDAVHDGKRALMHI